MKQKDNLNQLGTTPIRSKDTDEVTLTEEEKRKVLIQRQMSDLRDQKESLDSFNTKYDLADLDINLMVDIYSNLRFIMSVLEEMEERLSELEEDIQDAIIDVQNYVVKHKKYVETDEEYESVGQSPYMAFTSARMSLGSLTYRASRSPVWIQ